MRWYTLLFVVSFTAVLVRSSADAGGEKDKKEPDKAEKKNGKDAYLLVVPPTGGKEVKLADWRFTYGTRHFSLTADAPPNPKSKTPTGPEYLEFRELKSTTFRNGIFTLVPVASIRKITYEREKKTVAVVIINDAGEDVTLNGTTGFTTSNRLTIEAEAQLDGLGAATVKFQGGTDKGMHSITFPAPKAAEKTKGAPAVITADDKEKTKHTAFGVQPLYLVDGGYRVLPYVSFKKTVKIDMDKIASIRFVPSDDKKKLSTDYEVTLRDGAKHILSLLTTVELEKKKTMTFVGLVGRVPVGYKLFSVDAIFEYRAADDEKK